MEKCEICGKEWSSVNAAWRKTEHMKSCRAEKEQKDRDDPRINTETAGSQDPKVQTPAEPEMTELERRTIELRTKREPFNARQQHFTCPENDGYQYRVVNDDWAAKPDNLNNMKRRGYEFYEDENGERISQVVGTNDGGTPITGHLMRIPKVIYNEDQQAKQKDVDIVDQQIKSGSVQQQPGDNRYIPSTGINITSDTKPL